MRRMIHQLFFVRFKINMLFIILSIFINLFIFITGRSHTILAYMLYPIGFYTLIITTISIIEYVKRWLKKFPIVIKYQTDIQLKMKIKLFTSMIINISYAMMKLIIGYLYLSIWEIHIGIYYLIICIIRFFLFYHVKYMKFGKDLVSEYKKSIICGYGLLLLTFIFSGMVFLMVYRNYTYSYPGYLIYVAALYTFYNVISGIINIIKYYKYHSPLLNTSNDIYFICALVSLLSLQTAMLHTFNNEGGRMIQLSNGITGLVVCMIILMISLYMIIHSKKKLSNSTTF